MHQNSTNCTKKKFRVQWGGSGAFVAKNSNATLWHEQLHQLTRFALSVVGQKNGPKCTQIVRNAPKHEFRVQWGGSGAFVAKRSNGTSWHELLHQFGLFCLEFFMATKRSKCTQIVRNTAKRQFRVQWGGSGALVVKNSDATSWHELLQ